MAKPSNVSRLVWHFWGLCDLRDESLQWLTDRGLPMTAILPLNRLPLFLGAAEYACKASIWQAPVMVLDQLEFEAQSWFN